MKSAAVSEKQGLGLSWIGNYAAVKALSFIPRGNQDFSIHAASAAQEHVFFRILVIAMDYGIGESFEYGDFDFIFGLSRHAKFPYGQLDA